MAKNYIRNIAKQHNVSPEELASFLGAKNASVQVDENDPRIGKFLRQSKNTDQQSSNDGLNVTTEVEATYLQALRRQAKFASLYGRKFYAGEISRCHELSTSELLLEMEQDGDINTEEAAENFDFFTMIHQSGNHQVAVLSLPTMNMKALKSTELLTETTEIPSVMKQEVLSLETDSSETQQ